MTGPSAWIGKKLGDRYIIEELLGQGGMSAVYKATDPNLGRVVAVKLIHPHLSADPQFVRRFEEEARAVAQLRHPNIIQVYDFNHDEDVYYIVFEFVPGETLQDRIKRLRQEGRPMDVEKAVAITAGVADALQYAHERGLIHRDVKPANVMLNVFGEPILMDFGIVKILGGTQHTATGAVMGTARYMSPEQIQGTQVDERTDIYSLGVLLFEMVGGRAPYEADSAMTVMMMHINDPVPDVTRLRPAVSPAVKRIVERTLSKGREDRFASAGEVAAALRGADLDEAPQVPDAEMTVLDAPMAPPPAEKATAAASPATTRRPPAAAPPTAAPPATTGTAAPPADNRRLLMAGAAGVVVVLLILLAVFVLPGLGGGDGDGALPGGGETAQNGGDAATPDAGGAPPAGGGETEAVAGVATEAATATPAPVATSTPEPSPTTVPDRDEDGVADAADACPDEAAGLYPDPDRQGCPLPPTATATPTATPTPTVIPTPTLPPGPQVRIQSIGITDNRYIVAYETFEYQEQLPGMHVHFFFDTVPPDQAGLPGSGPWFVWGGPRPFNGYTVADRPAAANRMCALVANPDHSAIANSGNCMALPPSS